MGGGNISVVVCDDSALMRNLVGKMVENADGLELAGKAMNGRFLLQKLPRLKPDIIVLDIEMPEMNGIEFLRERKKQNIDIPVIILSSIARKGAQVTMEALSLGASDFITKPSGSISEDIHLVEKQLVAMLKAYGGRYRSLTPRSVPPETPGGRTGGLSRPDISPEKTAEAAPRESVTVMEAPEIEISTVEAPVSRQEAGVIELVAIGISTGGPNALRKVFAQIDRAFPVPIVVVQHMPSGFTLEFAKSLDRICPLEVKEASDGDLLKAGRILICPGDYHIEVEKRRLAGMVRLNQKTIVNGHRPSVDVLFASVAKEYGGHAMAVIMTGMGKDGAAEIGGIHRQGGITIAQDQASSIVYGMPRVAAEMKHIQHIVALDEMAATINRMVRS